MTRSRSAAGRLDVCSLCGQPITPNARDPVVLLDGDSLYCHASCIGDTVPPKSDGTSQAPRAQELLAAIVQSSDDAIVSKTLNGTITSWNAGAERLFGYTAAEAIGQPVTILIPEDRLNEETAILERLRRGERIDHYETVRQAKNGRQIDVSITVSPIRDERGVIVGASKVARDIGLQKDTQRKLEEADVRKNEFLALLAHELRNPLGPIRHAVKILRAKTPTPSELDWASSIIERQSEHMGRLVEDLLDVSRISRGTIELRREHVDLATVLESAVEAGSELIEKSRHRLTVSMPAEPLSVEGDFTRLTQIVANLIDNAAKYTESRGEISLSAEREGDEAVIRVKDSGIGIPPDLLPTIFDMFTQASQPQERAQGGLGVGLALVERLVQLHGGQVAAFSEGEGRGSEFVVRLPLATQTQERRAMTGGGGALNLSRAACRILVVDDNEDSADSLAMLLRMMGHDVRTANEGLEALAVAATYQPEIAILDIGLPKISGYEIARRIRQQLWARNAVLIALTGWGQEDHRRQSAEAGFDHHLTKPVDMVTLERLIQSVRGCATG